MGWYSPTNSDADGQNVKLHELYLIYNDWWASSTTYNNNNDTDVSNKGSKVLQVGTTEMLFKKKL